MIKPTRRALIAGAGGLAAASAADARSLLFQPGGGPGIPVGPPPGPPLTTLFPVLGDSDRNYGGIALYLMPYVYSPYDAETNTGCSKITGTVTLELGLYAFGVTPPVNTMTVQWMLNDQPLGSPILGPTIIGTNNFQLSWNTTLGPDGIYSLYIKVIDSTSGINYLQPYRIRSNSLYCAVHNSGPLGTGSMVIPVAPTSVPAFMMQPKPDFITYPGGTPPQMNTTPYPTQPSPPATTTAERNFLVDAQNWYAEDIPGDRDFEYDYNSRLRTTTIGGVFVQQQYSISNLDLEDAIVTINRHNPFDGERNNTLVDPYSTFFASIADVTDWYAVNAQGGFFEINHETGETETIAGWRQDRTKLPIDKDDVGSSLATIYAKYEFVGQMGTPSFDTMKMIGLNDGCQDPRDHNVFFLTNPLEHFIIKVDENTTPPTVTRYAGQPGTHGYADGNSLTTALFYSPYSIIISDGTGNQGPIGTIYVADFNNWAIRKISPDGSTVTTLVGKQTGKDTPTPASRSFNYLGLENPAISDTWSPPGTVAFADAYVGTPQVIRFASGGDIVFFENGSSILRRINMAASTVSRIYATDWDRNGTVWSWMDVDRFGTCGPLDNILMAKGATSGAVPLKLFSLDGSYFANFAGDGAGYLPEGPLSPGTSISQPAPGYAWAVAFSRLEARILLTGFRINGYTMWRKKLPGDPVVNYPSGIGLVVPRYVDGQQIYRRGTCLCFPFNSRPALSRLHGPWGRSWLGSSIAPSFDELNLLYPTDAALGAYIQGGMGGSVPRPEITGNDLRDIIYYIRRSTAAGAYPTTAVPGANNPDVTAPVVSSVVATRLSSTSISVQWNTDKPTIGMAVAGTATSVGSDTPYHLWSPLETSYLTVHDRTITGLPAVTPIHYNLVSKDLAGNVTSIADGTV